MIGRLLLLVVVIFVGVMYYSLKSIAKGKAKNGILAMGGFVVGMFLMYRGLLYFIGCM